MAEAFRIEDRGDNRVLWVGDRPSIPTHYSERVIRMLIERKGADRAPLYFPFKTDRAPRFLDPLFRYLRGRGAKNLRVLEVGCSFGHMTEYLAEQPEVSSISTFDTDEAFVEIANTKAKELGLAKVQEILHLDQAATRKLPWPDRVFDLVLAIGVVEHLPERHRRAQVDEYWRVLAPGGYIAFLDTPNRYFLWETHSLDLPLVQFLPPRLAHRYAKLFGRSNVAFEVFVADGTGWRNATIAECLSSEGRAGVDDVTEEAGYGLRYFRNQYAHDSAHAKTRRARIRRAMLRPVDAVAGGLAAVGVSPSRALPYLNLLFRRAR
jgi:2-polyprenyl-3-methyl-5-hydroxy-6-metoxy-1,4-benzoquinol methylase